VETLWQARDRERVLRWAIGVMAILAVLKLGDEFRRLLFETSRSGAIDLKVFYQEYVRNWLARGGLQPDNPYPPASLPFLALLGFGWLGETGARWLWAVSMVVVACLFARVLVKESGADSMPERVFVVLMLLSMNATGVTLGNGQITLHVLFLVTAPIVFLDRHAEWRPMTLLALAGLLVSLVKPSNSVPFFALLLVRKQGVRNVAAVAVAYVAVTLFAVWFQGQPLLAFLDNSIASGRIAATQGGYANLDNWLTTLAWSGWSLTAASVALAALAVWLFLHRDADLWVLLGVTAIVTRLWMYHRVYDDMLVLLPMIALFRIARDDREHATAERARVLLAIMVVAMLAPARLELLPFPWHLLFTAGHALVWLAAGAFLMQQAHARARLQPAH
jgi:small neutral amino acid transporter SnatA (MarC family)